MTDVVTERAGGVRVLECSVDGPLIASEADAVDLIGKSSGTDLVILPTARIADDFFELRTRVAGEIIQKFQSYRVHLVIVGDISARLAESRSLRDFVYESNRGRQLWFVTDLAELDARLEELSR